MRHEYSTKGLSETDVDADPMTQFGTWFAEAVEADIEEPNAMVVSTVNAASEPSSRILLLKGLTATGFEFYTNYQSNKAVELATNPNVALTFPWIQLSRQVNVYGRVAKLDESESDAYFAVRPRESKLGAWASNQSRPLTDRAQLDQQMVDVSQRFGDDVPRPPHWGGYLVTPRVIEFWQGRPNRLHDRLRFTSAAETQDSAGSWMLTRLNP